ncbi:endonuclease MutS2, partial [Campylobacter volucris]|nr:endonuclease MutS2 [Campylobacter volucris]
MTQELFKKLDLDSYIAEFKNFFARDKDVFLQGDSKLHFKRIDELCKIDFTSPPSISNLNTALTHLSKQGILHLDQSFELIKICMYFRYLKGLKFEESLKEWLLKIEIPQVITELFEYFDEKGQIKESIDERLINLNLSLKLKKESLTAEFKKLTYTKNLTPYFIDTQIHLINGMEALLVRGGFNHTLKAKIIGRSSGGGFYVVPLSVEKIQSQIDEIENAKEEIYYEYAK